MLIAAIIAGIVVACRKFAPSPTVLAVLTAFALLVCADTSRASEVEGRRITVRMSCPERGVLYVFLVDKEMFDRPMLGLQKRVLRIAGISVATISFNNVPPGTYGVRGFLDTNGNGKLDRGLFGPTEPWGMSFHSGRPERWPRWDQIKFTVAEVDKSINIVMAQ
jgi:uncharacterized protein (DUF2141 family)